MPSVVVISRIAAVVMFFIPGVLALTLGVFRSRWFYDSGHADYWQRRMGAKGARIFYLLLGLALLACGVLLWADPRGIVSE